MIRSDRFWKCVFVIIVRRDPDTDELYEIRQVLWFWCMAVCIIMGPQRRPALARFFAGTRDWTRGRHWDRRHRYGEK
jgi:hypothetical protein